MGKINIKTTLDICPRHKCKHEILVITRGATASIDYDLTSKVYTMDNIEQFTYLFKQSKKILSFDMVDYIKLSLDNSVVAGKRYYKNVVLPNINESYQCEGTEVLNPTGSPASQGWYEVVKLEENQDWTYWIMNRHFNYIDLGDYQYINFILYSSETKTLDLTEPDCNMKCEVAIRLDTDNMSGMRGLDSVIVEEQHPIAVIDSLYSKLK